MKKKIKHLLIEVIWLYNNSTIVDCCRCKLANFVLKYCCYIWATCISYW